MSVVIEPLYDKEKTCLLCQNSFNTKRLRSRFIRTKHVQSDFCTEYKDPTLNPMFYEVDVCPNCGFAFTEAFSSTFPPETMETIKTKLKNWKFQDFGQERTVEQVIRVYKLAILTANLKKEKHVIIAGLCLRLAWLYRFWNDEEQEQRFLTGALEKYNASFRSGDFKDMNMSELKLLYLLGELSRRVGRVEDAIQYFSRVVQHKNRHTEPKIVEMAREQWYEIRNGQEEVPIPN
ncbi:DUF2225 domain-containing protein [Halalkalibacterium ligniniphilum]|uniref:DUF2225 domain-containing protein n=1 Tax=Halalkalibacterium ligniniphilum TaxID=1134413 RepID=UPI0003605B0C|nr:DUF2225 domain-containing protein [Halalkalibacterium ligniniphilum]